MEGFYMDDMTQIGAEFTEPIKKTDKVSSAGLVTGEIYEKFRNDTLDDVISIVIEPDKDMPIPDTTGNGVSTEDLLIDSFKNKKFDKTSNLKENICDIYNTTVEALIYVHGPIETDFKSKWAAKASLFTNQSKTPTAVIKDANYGYTQSNLNKLFDVYYNIYESLSMIHTNDKDSYYDSIFRLNEEILSGLKAIDPNFTLAVESKDRDVFIMLQNILAKSKESNTIYNILMNIVGLTRNQNPISNPINILNFDHFKQFDTISRDIVTMHVKAPDPLNNLVDIETNLNGELSVLLSFFNELVYQSNNILLNVAEDMCKVNEMIEPVSKSPKTDTDNSLMSKIFTINPYMSGGYWFLSEIDAANHDITRTMNIIRDHNSVVKPNDVFVLLGRITSPSFFENGQFKCPKTAAKLTELVHKLNGKKILIKSKDDPGDDDFYKRLGFVEVHDGPVYIGDYIFTADVSELDDDGKIIICDHDYGLSKTEENIINTVCVGNITRDEPIRLSKAIMDLRFRTFNLNRSSNMDLRHNEQLARESLSNDEKRNIVNLSFESYFKESYKDMMSIEKLNESIYEYDDNYVTTANILKHKFNTLSLEDDAGKKELKTKFSSNVKMWLIKIWNFIVNIFTKIASVIVNLIKSLILFVKKKRMMNSSIQERIRRFLADPQSLRTLIDDDVLINGKITTIVAKDGKTPLTIKHLGDFILKNSELENFFKRNKTYLSNLQSAYNTTNLKNFLNQYVIPDNDVDSLESKFTELEQTVRSGIASAILSGEITQPEENAPKTVSSALMAGDIKGAANMLVFGIPKPAKAKIGIVEFMGLSKDYLQNVKEQAEDGDRTEVFKSAADKLLKELQATVGYYTSCTTAILDNGGLIDTLTQVIKRYKKTSGEDSKNIKDMNKEITARLKEFDTESDKDNKIAAKMKRFTSLLLLVKRTKQHFVSFRQEIIGNLIATVYIMDHAVQMIFARDTIKDLKKMKDDVFQNKYGDRMSEPYGPNSPDEAFGKSPDFDEDLYQKGDESLKDDPLKNYFNPNL